PTKEAAILAKAFGVSYGSSLAGCLIAIEEKRQIKIKDNETNASRWNRIEDLYIDANLQGEFKKRYGEPREMTFEARLNKAKEFLYQDSIKVRKLTGGGYASQEEWQKLQADWK